MIPLSRAIAASKKRLRFMPEKQQNENLEYACSSLAEAYRIGAEEAQQEILSRLRALERPPCNERENEREASCTKQP